MCELTLVNLRNKNLNTTFGALQLLRNSEIYNRDGFGFFGNRVWKSASSPDLILNLGELVNHVTTENPLMCHVRAATATNGKKEVEVSNSHPFEETSFVLAHNGSLEFKEYRRMYDKKYDKMIDSRIFSARLQEIIDDNPKMLFKDALKTAMEEFRGKFAFLIYQKEEQDFYVVRGITAKLHISYITLNKNQIGYVINTESDHLRKNLDVFSSIFQTIYDERVEYSLPKEIPAESIFVAGKDDIQYVDEIKETVIPKTTTTTTTYYGGRGDYDYYGAPRNYKNTTENLNTKSTTTEEIKEDYLQKFFQIMDDFSLSTQEMEILAQVSVGKNILEMNQTELKEFGVTLHKLLKMNHTAKKEEIWTDILSFYGEPHTAYWDQELQFPYMFNRVRALNKSSDDLVLDEKDITGDFPSCIC